MSGLGREQAEEFHDRGCLLLPALLDPGVFLPLARELEAAIDGLARRQREEGLLARLHEDAPFDRRLALLCAESRRPDEFWRAVHGKHHKTAGLFHVFTAPALLDAAESLLGPEIYAHPQFNLRAKLPRHEQTVVPWHQDLGYLDPDADGTLMVNFWIPLVPASMDMGALQVIPGSHRWGLIPHERIGGYLGIPESALPPHERLDCPVPLGGALMLQHKTVHRSVPNVSNRVRWSLDLRFCRPGDATGRAAVPGFLARSRARPESVARTWQDWARLFAD